MWHFATLFDRVAALNYGSDDMLKDRVTAHQRLNVPLAWKLNRLRLKFNFLFKRNAGMALSKEAKNLIRFYVSERKTLETLTPSEYRHLVAENLRYHPDKSSILADADEHILLPNLVADVIEKNASIDVNKLINGIMDIFVNGMFKQKTAFDLDFDEAFEDEWSEQHPTVNEDFYHDSLERARAARWGMEN